MAGNPFTPHKQVTHERELFISEGDVADPMGGRSRGHQQTMHLEKMKIGVPKVAYKSRAGDTFELTCDVYQATPSEPMMVYLYCPMCSRKGAMHTLTIRADRKRIAYDLTDRSPVPVSWANLPDRGGRLDVEKFKCTYEIDGTRGVSAVSSANLCGWSVVIENNIARDAG